MNVVDAPNIGMPFNQCDFDRFNTRIYLPNKDGKPVIKQSHKIIAYIYDVAYIALAVAFHAVATYTLINATATHNEQSSVLG